MMKTVMIDGVEYTMKYSLRAFFVYEHITGRPYEGGKLLNLYLLMYAMLLSGNPSFQMAFDEFISLCDTRTDLFGDFMQLLKEEEGRISSFLPPAGDKKKA